ncbi:hypothetical protein SHTP_0224 [Mycobacterium ulcerans subsp. shinshuense]|uniref:Glutamate--cysteine ligase n=1 Tax=Mycobacterium ulcerans subsp. shinshuense TaxID=1124626 RepID=A0A1B4XXU1_MYCUL|nr:hypothetical protein SHTP_0224 [Mycobacterium ulcerans subsp. shinshuense]
MQPGRRRLSARHVESVCAGRDRRPGLSNRIGRVQYRVQCAAPAASRRYRPAAGKGGKGQPQRCRAEGELRRRPHRDDRHSAHADAPALRARLDERIDPLQRTQRLHLRCPRRGHPDQYLGPGAIELAGGIHCPRIRLHQYAIASAGVARRFRAQLECGPDAGRAAAGAGRQFTLFFRPPAVGGDADRGFYPIHRHPAGGAQDAGGAPPVWFGEQWITSILDLFKENVRYFPSLLPEVSDEGPVAELAAGRAPQLAELRLHNGTVYRWNRPVYDVADGRPHLRLENRVLPAGPTVIDMLANSAFYYGALRTLAEADPQPWTKMSFATAQDSFLTAARYGIDARLHWPGLGEVTTQQLVLGTLLPMAHEGLQRSGVADEVRERFLGVIEARAESRRNGASWQVATVAALQDRGMNRDDALAEMLRRYCEHMHANEPVHSWPIERE